MSILSGLISTATNAVGTNENAQANAAKSNMSAALQRAQLQRQDQQDLLQQAIQAREAQSQAYKDQLVQSQTKEAQYKADHPLIDPNSPGVFAQKTQMEQNKIDYERTNGYHAPHNIDPLSPEGQRAQIAVANARAAQKPMSASQRKAVATNMTSASTIDKALKNLESHQGSVGLLRGRSDYADQFFDPEGVDTRALIANVGSQIVHDRSGAAVTVSEYPRLAPFIPSVHDKPDAIKRKLQLLRDAIATETEALGGEIPSAPSDGAHPIKSKYGLD